MIRVLVIIADASGFNGMLCYLPPKLGMNPTPAERAILI
jgi:hypothetical protein